MALSMQPAMLTGSVKRSWSGESSRCGGGGGVLRSHLRGNTPGRGRVVTHMSMGFSLPFGLGSHSTDDADDEEVMRSSAVLFPAQEETSACADDLTTLVRRRHSLDGSNSHQGGSEGAISSLAESPHGQAASTSAVVRIWEGRWED